MRFLDHRKDEVHRKKERKEDEGKIREDDGTQLITEQTVQFLSANKNPSLVCMPIT